MPNALEIAGLTDRQERFCQEYLIDFNATQAAIRAGFSKKTAGQAASRLLKNVKLAARLGQLAQGLQEKTGIEQEWVLNNLREVAERCMQKAPVMRYDRESKDYVQAQDENGNNLWTFQAMSANRSLELIGKQLGMFADNVNVNIVQATQELTAKLIAAVDVSLDKAQAIEDGRQMLTAEGADQIREWIGEEMSR